MELIGVLFVGLHSLGILHYSAFQIKVRWFSDSNTSSRNTHCFKCHFSEQRTTQTKLPLPKGGCRYFRHIKQNISAWLHTNRGFVIWVKRILTLKKKKKEKKNTNCFYIRSNFSLRNSSTLSVFHLRMLSSSAMFPLSSKSFSTGSEPLTYYSEGEGEWVREKHR